MHLRDKYLVEIFLTRTSRKRKDFTTIPRKSTAGQAGTTEHEEFIFLALPFLAG
jgi:hypothetical protein